MATATSLVDNASGLIILGRSCEVAEPIWCEGAICTNVNDIDQKVNVTRNIRLHRILRGVIGLPGINFGCGIAQWKGGAGVP